MGVYPLEVVGESFANDDGSNRQVEIGRCRPGEPVVLARDPENRFDDRCVRVISSRGVQIGNISRDRPWVADLIDKGRFLDAAIRSIGRGESGLLGVVLSVRTRPDDPPHEVERPRRWWHLFALPLALAMFPAEPVRATETAVQRSIVQFCGGGASCVAVQRSSLKKYLGVSVAYGADDWIMERCMRAGKSGRFVDWTKAERCLRLWAKGRRAVLPGRPSSQPNR